MMHPWSCDHDKNRPCIMICATCGSMDCMSHLRGIHSAGSISWCGPCPISWECTSKARSQTVLHPHFTLTPPPPPPPPRARGFQAVPPYNNRLPLIFIHFYGLLTEAQIEPNDRVPHAEQKNSERQLNLIRISSSISIGHNAQECNAILQ